MMKKMGLYLFPISNQKFNLVFCDGKKFKKLYSESFTNEIMNILDTDDKEMDIVLHDVDHKLVKNKNFSLKEATFTILHNMEVAKTIKGMNNTLGLLLQTELSKIEKFSPDDRKGYERVLSLQQRIYQSFGKAYKHTMALTYFYANLFCSLSEKPGLILYIDDDILGNTFQEGYFVVNKPFLRTAPKLTKYYYFDSASNYLSFLIFQLVRLNPNICLCHNCKKLFEAKTKKRTLYCSRIQPDTNKKCSEIGPKIRADRQSGLSGYEDYEKAVNQNYQRARRTEENYARDAFLDWKDYYSWLERAQEAKKQWQNEEISNEEFLQIVHELD